MEERKIDIISAVFGKIPFIAYRPELRNITGSITSAILLQQIVQRWNKNGKFYKFKEPCLHKAYRNGDSWCEELGFSAEEFDSAIRQIGFKLGNGLKKQKFAQKEDAFVVYYTDRNRFTWYTVNSGLLEEPLKTVYYPITENTTENTNCVAQNLRSAVSVEKQNNEQTPMNRTQFIDWCKKSKQRHINLIGEWVEIWENVSFEKKSEWKVYISRNLRAARDLSVFSPQKIDDALDKIYKDLKEKRMTYTPKMETILKKITL